MRSSHCTARHGAHIGLADPPAAETPDPEDSLEECLVARGEPLKSDRDRTSVGSRPFPLSTSSAPPAAPPTALQRNISAEPTTSPTRHPDATSKYTGHDVFSSSSFILPPPPFLPWPGCEAKSRDSPLRPKSVRGVSGHSPACHTHVYHCCRCSRRGRLGLPSPSSHAGRTAGRIVI
jgi:hypothetical protein